MEHFSNLSFARRLFLAFGLFLVALALACGSPAPATCGGLLQPPCCDADQEACGGGCVPEGDVCCQTYRCQPGQVCAGIDDAGQGLCSGGGQ
jgi:hypothetical protein